jgi:hypothetical protein
MNGKKLSFGISAYSSYFANQNIEEPQEGKALSGDASNPPDNAARDFYERGYALALKQFRACIFAGLPMRIFGFGKNIKRSFASQKETNFGFWPNIPPWNAIRA